MNKNTKVTLEVIAKEYNVSTNNRNFINRANSEACCRENISVDRLPLTLIIIVSVFLCYDDMLLCVLLRKTLCFSFCL